MSLQLGTLDGSAIQVGFWGMDVSKVQLGELPLITTEQFAGYAAATIVKHLVPNLDPSIRAEWAEDMYHLCSYLGRLSVRRVTGALRTLSLKELVAEAQTMAPHDDRTELHTALRATLAPLGEALHYPDNPFSSDGRNVGFMNDRTLEHVVGGEDFFTLTYDVLRGGEFQWDEHGPYQSVKDAAVQIDTALRL